MCTNPILVKNLNADHYDRHYYKSKVRNLTGLNRKYKNIQDTAAYMYVPCGTCAECCAKKQMYLIQRCQEQSKDSHILFCTNTYLDSMLPTLEINGGDNPIVLWSDFVNMMKRCRKHNILPSYKYLAVNEYGGETHRPHIHYLLFIKKSSPSEDPYRVYQFAEDFEKFMISDLGWSRNISTNWRKPIYRHLSAFLRFPNGRSTYDVDSVLSDASNVSFYVSKYICKFDEWLKRKQQALRLNLSPEDYNFYWSYLRPRVMVSKGFGITAETPDYIKECISFSLSNDYNPKYFNSVGYGSPLSPYYKKRFLTVDAADAFACKNPDRLDSDSNTSDHRFRTNDELAAVDSSFSRKFKQIMQNNS